MTVTLTANLSAGGEDGFHIQYKVPSLFSHCWVQLFCKAMDCSPPSSSVLGISQARILECTAISFSRASSWPRDWTCVTSNGRRILYLWDTREAISFPTLYLYSLRKILMCMIFSWKSIFGLQYLLRASDNPMCGQILFFTVWCSPRSFVLFFPPKIDFLFLIQL